MTPQPRGDGPPNPPAPPAGGNTEPPRGADPRPIGGRTVGDLLDLVAARAPAPAAGACAALTVAVAAALTAKAARFATGQLRELAADADRLRAEAVPLADADGAAYGAVLAAARLPRDDPGRREQLADALAAATEIPLRIGRIGAEVAALAGRLEGEGNPNLRGDAQAAALLAEGARQGAMALVRINRELGDGAL